MLVDGHEVLAVLDNDDVARLGRVGAHQHRAVQRGQDALAGIGGDVRAEVLALGIEGGGHQAARGQVEDEAVGIGAGGDVGQVIFLGFLIFLAEVGLALGALHQGVLAQEGERIHALHGVGLDVPAEDVLDVHHVHVLTLQHPQEGVGAQGVVHHLLAHLAVHIPGQIVAQGGEGDNQCGHQE